MLVLLLINTMELSTAEQEFPAPQLSLGAPDYRPPIDFVYRHYRPLQLSLLQSRHEEKLC